MTTPVIGLGAGGHAKVIIEMLQADLTYEIVGLLDPDERLWGSRVLGVPVLGGDEELAGDRLIRVRHFFTGIGSVGETTHRRAAFERAARSGRLPITVIHKSAIVSPAATIGAGTVVMAAAVVNPGAEIGINVTVNTGAIVEHDCRIGDHVHIATGARLSGSVRVGDGAHVGAGATIRQGLRIGADAVVGAGAVVIRDVGPGTVVAGVPARPIGAVAADAGRRRDRRPTGE